MKRMPPLRYLAAGILLGGALLAVPVPILKHAPKPDYFVYVASKAKQGIYVYKFDPTTPALRPIVQDGSAAAQLASVTSLTSHPGNNFLYATTSKSSAAAYAIHQGDGALRLLNAVDLPGKDACAITAEKKGWMLLISYCGSGGVESFRVTGDGGFGESAGFQQHVGPDAHPRQVTITPDNFFLFIPDLNKVFQYRFDPARATFWPNIPAEVALKNGSRPVSLVFRPDQKFAYAADESGSALATFAYDHEKGTMKLVDSLPLPAHPRGADLDAAAKYLYVATSGEDGVLVFSIDRKKGTPKLAGKAPSGAAGSNQLRVDPTGRFLFVANATSGRITVLQIDAKTGLLSPTSLSIELPEPTSFQFVPMAADGLHQ